MNKEQRKVLSVFNAIIKAKEAYDTLDNCHYGIRSVQFDPKWLWGDGHSNNTYIGVPKEMLHSLAEALGETVVTEEHDYNHAGGSRRIKYSSFFYKGMKILAIE